MPTIVELKAMGVAIYEAKPRIVFCGHPHMSPCTVYRYEYGTLYVRKQIAYRSTWLTRYYTIDDMRIEV